MSDIVLRTNNLSKSYKSTKALDDFSLTIKKGDICGLVGNNGAGKTTLIRMIMGLSSPTSGSIELFGKSGKKALQQARSRMGAMVESPALYKDRTARENLEIHRIQRGLPDKEAINKALIDAGLEHTGSKKIKNFSLGMRQRLAISMALLCNPEFLILDEPTNGLDPSGIIELREMLIKLNKEQGVTLLISSHILAELSLLAKSYAIIHDGKLVQQLSKDDLQGKCSRALKVVVNNSKLACAIIESKLHTTNIKTVSNSEICLYDYVDDSPKVINTLLKAGVIIYEISIIGEELEDYFQKVTEEAIS